MNHNSSNYKKNSNYWWSKIHQ